MGRPKKEDQEKKKHRKVKVCDKLWNDYVEACKKSGVIPSAHIREMIRKVVESNKKLESQKEIKK